MSHPDPDTHPHAEPSPLPPPLIDALRAAHRPPRPASAALDARVLETYLHKDRRPTLVVGRMRWRTFAAAAGIALAAGAWLVGRSLLLAPEDLNRDRRVDILDAMTLAIAAGEGRVVPDVNHDRQGNAADADALAQRIVTLPARGST